MIPLEWGELEGLGLGELRGRPVDGVVRRVRRFAIWCLSFSMMRRASASSASVNSPKFLSFSASSCE